MQRFFCKFQSRNEFRVISDATSPTLLQSIFRVISDATATGTIAE